MARIKKVTGFPGYQPGVEISSGINIIPDQSIFIDKDGNFTPGDSSRVDNYNRYDTEIGPARDPNGSDSTGLGNPREWSETARKVINSVPYKIAYNLFSPLADQTWLNLLQAIPFSVDDAYQTIPDSMGFTSNYYDKMDANYQYCMEQISALMQEYRNHVNSLPKTQAQQYADAGINAAITGQGITSSEIPNIGTTTNPSSIQSANTGDFIRDSASFILDSVTGLSSVVQGFKNIRITEDNQFLDFQKWLRNEGIDYETSYDKRPRSLHEFFDVAFNRSDSNFIWRDPKGKTISSEEVIKSILHNETFAPVYQRWNNILSNDLSNPIYGDITGTWTVNNPIGIKAVSDAQYDSLMIGLERSLLENKLAILSSDNSIDIQERDIESKKLQNDLFDLHLQEAKVKFDLINRLKQSDSLEDILLLSKVLLGYNYDDIKILSAESSMISMEKSMGILGQIVSLLKPRNK